MINRKEFHVEQMIDEIIENFDFDRCQFTMEKLNWEWFPNGVPTLERLKNSARLRLKDVAKELSKKNNGLTSKDYYFSSSGGLKATGWRNRFGHVQALQLEFVLSEWQSDGD